jgi:hypothetical protein
MLIVKTVNYKKKAAFITNMKKKFNANQLKNVNHAMKSIGLIP